MVWCENAAPILWGNQGRSGVPERVELRRLATGGSGAFEAPGPSTGPLNKRSNIVHESQ